MDTLFIILVIIAGILIVKKITKPVKLIVAILILLMVIEALQNYGIVK